MTRPKQALCAALLGLCASAGSAACGDDETRQPPRPGLTTSSGSNAGGGGAGGNGGGGSNQGGGGSDPGCGNGAVDPGEDCDGADLGGKSCPDFGFDNGDLTCTLECTVETTTCSGVEQCQDAKDNDGDQLLDCDDQDCVAACADACASAQVVPDPVSTAGQTIGHASLAEAATCSDPSSGPAVVYEFTATTTGFLDIEQLTTVDTDLAISVRSTCAAVVTESACANDYAGMGATETISTPILEGETVYVVVSGSDATQAGAFTLLMGSRATVCGDGIQDPTEECEDLNTTSGDGCSDQCELEATEVEPNNTVVTANTFTAPFFAAISPAGDHDIVAITIPSEPSSLIVDTIDVAGGACFTDDLDSYLEILDASGTILLGSDDDSGIGLCARATVTGLPVGTVYVRVRAAVGAPAPTFSYRLDVSIIQDVCGDMAVTPGEQCDDGDVLAGDGCSPTCQFEPTETEPNDVSAQADGYVGPWLATIAPAGDVDMVAVTVPGPNSTIAASTSDYGTGACLANDLDSYLEILGTDGATVLQFDDNAGVGYCSAATATGLSAGTYFVRTRAAPLVPGATFFYELVVTAP